MATSGQADPGATIFGATAVTRPSMLVTVPRRSCWTAAGSTTSAYASDAPPCPVTTTTSARSSASRAPASSSTLPSRQPPSNKSALWSPARSASSWARASRPVLAASKRRQERRLRELCGQSPYGEVDDVGRLGDVRATDDEDHAVAVTDELARVVELALGEGDVQRERAVTERLGDQVRLAR